MKKIEIDQSLYKLFDDYKLNLYEKIAVTDELLKIRLQEQIDFHKKKTDFIINTFENIRLMIINKEL